MLTLFEELFLLCIHEDKGVVMESKLGCLNYGLSGALLAELALNGKVTVGENHRLVVLDANPTGDAIQNDALETIKGSEKERKFGYWIEHFSRKPEKFRQQLAERLVQKGVVKEEDERFSWVIPAPAAPDLNASAKFGLKNRIRNQVLASAPIQPREIALLSLVKVCDFIDLIFLKEERKIASRHIQEFMLGEAFKNPAAQAIEEIISAIEEHVEEEE